MLYVPICTFNRCNSEWLSIKTVFCPLTDKPQFTNQELLKYTTVGSHDPSILHTVSANSDLSCGL